MARLSGVDIPNQKRIEVALTYIYGIGLTSAKKILAATGINPTPAQRTLPTTISLSFVTKSRTTIRLKVSFAARPR